MDLPPLAFHGLVESVDEGSVVKCTKLKWKMGCRNSTLKTLIVDIEMFSKIGL